MKITAMAFLPLTDQEYARSMGEHKDKKAPAASEETGEITDEVLEEVAGGHAVNITFN